MELTLEWGINGHSHTFTMTDKEAIVIGRRRDCDIVLTDPHVSRRHAMIFCVDDVFYLRNISRTNTIPVDNQEQLNRHEIKSLKPGVVFQVGSLKMCVAAIQKLSREEILARVQQLKVRCPRCERKVRADLKYCPWCGTSLAYGSTVY